MPVRRVKKVEVEQKPSASASAALNFIIWGTGYIHNRKRLGLGLGFLITWILVLLLAIFSGMSFGTAMFLRFPIFLGILVYILLSLLLAYDAYKEVK